MPIYRIQAPAVKQETVFKGAVNERVLPAYRAVDFEICVSRDRVHYFANQLTAQGRRKPTVTHVGRRQQVKLSEFLKNIFNPH